ncbi:hypothetical protein ACI2KR_27325 [Pseudomonas luteola]
MKTTTPAKKNAAEISTDDLQQRISAFMKSGGTVEQIPAGKSAYSDKPVSKHIVISKG